MGGSIRAARRGRGARFAGATGALAALACAGAARADALSSPAMTPPLSANPNPIALDTGTPLGKLYVSGQFTALGLAQDNPAPNPVPGAGNAHTLLDVSNAQLELQTTSGPIQFYVQAGAYSFPTVGAPYIRAGKANDVYFGPVPVAYAKFVLSPEVSLQVGELPTLIGAESGFTFQNMNIERGLLWNQEPVVSKGVQANYAKGPLTVSLSINDGFDSDHYTWVSGLATWAPNASNSFTLDGGASFGTTYTAKFRAPNTVSNGAIADASYSWTHGRWLINPYVQYTHVQHEPSIGQTAADTYSGAVLAKYTLTKTFSLAGRVEYVDSRSDACTAADGATCAPTSLLYGPGSNAFSLTLTPTWQRGILFVRGEVSWVRAGGLTPGYGFGPALDARDQVRGLLETGVLF